MPAKACNPEETLDLGVPSDHEATVGTESPESRPAPLDRYAGDFREMTADLLGQYLDHRIIGGGNARSHFRLIAWAKEKST